MTRTTVLDIETTVRDGYEASFEELDCWEIWAIGVGFRASPTTTPETRILLRRDDTPESERRLVAQLTNYLRDCTPVDVLVTYNGTEFDIPILEQRAEGLIKHDRRRDQTLAVALFEALDISHRDLFAEICDRRPPDAKYPSLDESLAEYGVDARTATLNGEEVVGGDMPALGRRVMSGDVTAAEREAITEYIETDIGPLFGLADALAEERQERIEAEARAVTQTGQTGHNTEGGR